MLRELIDRVQSAEPEDQADMLGEAWDALAKTKMEFRRFAMGNAGKFALLVDAEAFESAAMMMVPQSGYFYLRLKSQNIDGDRWTADVSFEDGRDATCSTAALAILSASLKEWIDA